MTFDRVRNLFLGLGGIVLTAGGLWIAVTPGALSTRVWGAFGALFFSFGTWVTLRAALKGQWWPDQKGRALRRQQLVLPLVLVFTLPWALKLWFAVPLLVAWGLLVPQYQDRRALHAAVLVAVVLAIAQALVFCIAIVAAIQEAHGAGNIALQVCFLLIVLWLDGRLLWEVRSRLRPAAQA
ncbi:MAG TPA: hypothetical protein VH041_17250 [Caldimonas sp.]|jgi:hypothetical protein|nr:hypothetical protein [Caldimonas sp.]HEX4236037.1 hypothetical protein [Caldimonas sp.]